MGLQALLHQGLYDGDHPVRLGKHFILTSTSCSALCGLSCPVLGLYIFESAWHGVSMPHVQSLRAKPPNAV